MKRAIVGLVLLCCATALGNRETAQEHYKRGMAAFNLDDFEGAAKEFEAGYRDEPLPAFLFNLAQSYKHLGDRERALSFFRKYRALELDAALDRAEVDREIAELERTQAPPPVVAPTVTVATPQTTPIAPAIVTPPAEPAPSPAHRRWPIWVGVGAGVVLAALVIAVIAAPREPQLAAVVVP